MVPRNDDVQMIRCAEMPHEDGLTPEMMSEADAPVGPVQAGSALPCSAGETDNNGQCAAGGEHSGSDQTPPEDATSGSADDTSQGPEEGQIIKLVARILAQAGAYSVLNPGCGHGHCARFLARSGFTVTAFDLPSRLVRKARDQQDIPPASLRYHVDDPGLPTRKMGLFDGLYAPNLLHSMTRSSRQRVLRLLSKYVRPGGVALFSVLSDRDPRYGLGREVEPGTFEIVPGQVLHFYGDDEVIFELEAYFKISFMELVTEVEVDHQGNRREYTMILVGGIKRPT